MQWINEAITAGARKTAACEVAEISIRTLQRWCTEGIVVEDKRADAVRPVPANKLLESERLRVIEVCSTEEFRSTAPSQIVPKLADRGEYIASESTFYRILKAENMLEHRGRDKPKGSVKKPTSHNAKGPNEVWSWDISYLASRVIGQFFYLYLIMDIYSRKIVGWEVHTVESGELASKLLERTVWAEKCTNSEVVLHSDNGSPMKSLTMLAKMYELGVCASRSRPGVSNDNSYSESLFRTLKYCPRWPSEGFNCLEDAQQWVCDFVRWYNNDHQHSRIKFVTPNQRHLGEDKQILAKRYELYKAKRAANPQRWSGSVRNWNPVGDVLLNPENGKNKDQVTKAA